MITVCWIYSRVRHCRIIPDESLDTKLPFSVSDDYASQQINIFNIVHLKISITPVITNTPKQNKKITDFI